MRSDLTVLVETMARREAAAALLRPPPEEAGDQRPLVRLRSLACPTCGAQTHQRRRPHPFHDDADGHSGRPVAGGPVLWILACETITARAALPLVAAATATATASETGHREFRTRGSTWLELAHLPEDKALEAVNAAECWFTDPKGAMQVHDRTLPASTRRCVQNSAWPEYRSTLAPSFLSPHPTTLPAGLEHVYAVEFRAAIVKAYEQRRPDRAEARARSA